MLQQNRRYCRISSSVKDGPPSTLVDKDREREKNRINLNIVLRGQDDQDCSAVDGESLLGIGVNLSTLIWATHLIWSKPSPCRLDAT